MEPLPDNVFALPERLAAKAAPALVASDQAHFAAIAASLDRTVADLARRLEAERLAPAGSGQRALDRDQEIHRLTARLRTLRRFGVDLCLGRVVPADGGDPVYVGRLGLTDGADDGRRLLVDWRSPAAAPFSGATHAHPMGLASRRRYRWTGGRITDYWDEVFDGTERTAAFDDQSAFIASLSATRSPRMRDVLGTIAADQDAVIRAGSAGTLVVDGGPGTGKTVVALHRAAYLLYADPRLGPRRGGVLFVGPHQPYLDYVADVLPGLGEEGVHTCTLRDLVREGSALTEETDDRVAALKATARVTEAIENAVLFHEEPPARGLTVETDWGDLRLHPDDWTEAFAAPTPGTPHDDARDQVFEELLTTLLDRDRTGAPPHLLRRALVGNEELVTAFNRAWPLLAAADVVGDLWSVPAYLRHCAPWLAPDEVRALQRTDPHAWTTSDLPWLDAARRRLGDPDGARVRQVQRATIAAYRERMEQVVDDLTATDDSEMKLMSMLTGADARHDLDDGATLPALPTDPLAGPFAHVVVDEAQELTDAEWQMLLARCPSRSFTVVGDRAQARHGFAETWDERLTRVGLDRVTTATLRINYRTPAEIMAEAEPVIRAVLPDVNVPTSIRRGGRPVEHGSVRDLDEVVAAWAREHDDGVACVIGAADFEPTARVRSLTPVTAKGLEFDLVVLVEPESFGTGVAGAVDRYVAMTRATGRLVVLTA
ncbi:RNA polymerase recycling motor ATPase HelR [Jatrophihabitans sp. YIM 134969]